MSYDTAQSIISDAAAEMGLGAVSDAYGSTDGNVAQLRALLKAAGRDLARKREWRQLVREHVITTTSAAEYPLPADFGAMLSQTAWNRTTPAEMAPAGPNVWQQLKATQAGVLFTAIFRLQAQTLTLWPDPPVSGDVVAFEYLSRFWVQSNGAASPDKAAPTVNTDVVLFEPGLAVAALKYHFLRAKGFDSSAAAQDYRDLYEQASSGDSGGAPVLALSGRGYRDRLLDMRNGPTTGYGFDSVGLY